VVEGPMVSDGKWSGVGGHPHLGFDGGGEVAARSRSGRLLLHFKAVGGSSLWRVFFQGKGGVAPGDLGDASWLDGRARAASERLGDGGWMESMWQWDLVL
jgi:hypothetical protein